MASLGSLVTNVIANVAPFQKGMRQAQGSMKATQKAMGGLRSAAGALGVTFGVAGIAGFLKSSISAFDEQAKATADLEQALRSTNNAAGLTLGTIMRFADARQQITLFGDEVTEKGAAILATFTNIREQAFLRTLAVAQDMSTRMKQDLNSTLVQLGKALNDPVANLGALSRAGVQFSVDQKALIKSLTEENKLIEAQQIILAELERQFGGAAEAAAKAGAGPIQQLSNTLGDIKEALGGPIAAALAESAIELKQLLDRLGIGPTDAAALEGTQSDALRQQRGEAQSSANAARFAENFFRFTGFPVDKLVASMIANIFEQQEDAINEELERRIEATGTRGGSSTPVATHIVEDLKQASEEQVRLNRRQVELHEQEVAIARFQQDGTW